MQWATTGCNADRVRKLELAIENCFMLARRKRAIRYTYPTDGGDPIPRGPRSDDADWDHIVRFCRSVGVEESILRTAETTNEQQ